MRVLSAEEKLVAIRRIVKGESKASVARDIGIPESTLRGWYKSSVKAGMPINKEPTTLNSDQSNSSGSQSASFNGNMNGIASGSASIMDDEGPAGKRLRLDHAVPTTSSSCYVNNLPADMNNIQQAHHQVNQNTAQQIDPKAYERLMQAFTPTADFNAYGIDINYVDLAKSVINAMKNTRATVNNNGLQFVNNGLQYAKNPTMLANCSSAVAGGSLNNQNIGNKRHSAAIAPLQIDAVKACMRKYLQPAAEAPLNLIPETPKKTTDNFGFSSNNSSSGSNLSNFNSSGNVTLSSPGTSGGSNCVTPSNSGIYATDMTNSHKLKKNSVVGTGISSTSTPIGTSSNTGINNSTVLSNSLHEALFGWLNLQHMFQQDVPLNLSSINGQCDTPASIWQMYTQLSFPFQSARTGTQNPVPSSSNNPGRSPDTKKTKNKLLDNVLSFQESQQYQQQQQEECRQQYQQQQEDCRQQFVQEMQMQRQPTTTRNVPANNNTTHNDSTNNVREPEGSLQTKEDAIRCCEKLLAWLNHCQDPSVTRYQILNITSLSLQLKNSMNHNDHRKNDRK